MQPYLPFSFEELDMFEPDEDCEDYVEDEGEGYCFTCNNTGSIDCECGGDICVCLESDNGLLPCPDCERGY